MKVISCQMKFYFLVMISKSVISSSVALTNKVYCLLFQSPQEDFHLRTLTGRGITGVAGVLMMTAM